MHYIAFFCRIPVVLESRRSCQEGGEGHTLHPPPRSTPGVPHYICSHNGNMEFLVSEGCTHSFISLCGLFISLP